MSEFKFGKKSLERLSQCDERLQKLCQAMIDRSEFDLTITCGYRGREEQEDAFAKGNSKAHFGQSKHNFKPSQAVDICPFPLNWDVNDIRWYKMISSAYEIARQQGIKIRSGRFFAFRDLPHIELVD